MKTRFRLTTIVFVIIVLIGFSVIATKAMMQIDWLNFLNNPISKFALIAISSLLVLGGILVIGHFTLKIYIDDNLEKIKFLYPFKLRSKEYEFHQIQGFRFKYLSARIEYKGIQFKTDDDNIYMVSDFETSNLRVLEKHCLLNFELRGESFKRLDEREKAFEIKMTRRFDKSQAKDIRLGLVFSICLCSFILFMIIKQGLEDSCSANLIFHVLVVLTLLSMIIGLIRWMIKNERVINNSA